MHMSRSNGRTKKKYFQMRYGKRCASPWDRNTRSPASFACHMGVLDALKKNGEKTEALAVAVAAVEKT
jgi:hypothetical protein